jgi:hypothetical protein
VERQSSSVISSDPASCSVSRPRDSQRSRPAAIQNEGLSISEKDCCHMNSFSSDGGADDKSWTETLKLLDVRLPTAWLRALSKWWINCDAIFLRSGTRTRPAFHHRSPQPENRLRLDLGNPRKVDTHHFSYFAKCQLFIKVQTEHSSFGPGDAID